MRAFFRLQIVIHFFVLGLWGGLLFTYHRRDHDGDDIGGIFVAVFFLMAWIPAIGLYTIVGGVALFVPKRPAIWVHLVLSTIITLTLFGLGITIIVVALFYLHILACALIFVSLIVLWVAGVMYDKTLTAQTAVNTLNSTTESFRVDLTYRKIFLIIVLCYSGISIISCIIFSVIDPLNITTVAYGAFSIVLVIISAVFYKRDTLSYVTTQFSLFSVLFALSISSSIWTLSIVSSKAVIILHILNSLLWLSYVVIYVGLNKKVPEEYAVISSNKPEL
eukprot:TRINITY_DN5038_c0_g1_i1.p1 TRINITY_DN5038_c0_g1~~TRINITY_DN5038_c0_g1_i1.p1  ORF type:complete len:277 (-),score=8.60 TRINITY_DN5038_c0_g1_i1:14-844(-)